MWRTAEIRWWRKGAPPAPLAEWLLRSVAPLKDFRTDLYLADKTQTDIGIKRRASDAVEVKMLYGLPDISLPPAMQGQAELWVKAESGTLPLSDENTIGVGKQRRRRILEFADGGWKEGVSEDEIDEGVSAELTEIESGGEDWTTVCFEAFGGEEARLVTLLQSAIILFGPWPAGVPAPALIGGYPLWLSQRAEA